LCPISLQAPAEFCSCAACALPPFAIVRRRRRPPSPREGQHDGSEEEESSRAGQAPQAAEARRGSNTSVAQNFALGSSTRAGGFDFLIFSLSCSIPSQGKKLGKKADMTEFRAQLDSLGLKIVEVNADGNCFFRFKIRLILLIVHVPVVLIKRGYLILIDMLVHIFIYALFELYDYSL